MKIPVTIILAFLFAVNANAQSILVRDHKGIVVNNDTLEYAPEFTQKPPYTEIDCKLYAQNNTSTTINLLVKKAELSTDTNADHAICFEQHCYTPDVYVAPVTVSLTPMDADSSFKGQYRYIKENHTPGKYLVSYTFFNNDNPTDSAIVYVLYNTGSITSAVNNMALQNNIRIYPNPATDIVNITTTNKLNATLTITNNMGAVVHRQLLTDTHQATIPTASWATGMYYYTIAAGSKSTSGRIVIK